jgi:hypothetical protein
VDDASIRTGSGSTQVHLAPGSSVRVEASSSSGVVRVLGFKADDHRASGTVGGGAARLSIESASGSIRVDT